MHITLIALIIAAYLARMFLWRQKEKKTEYSGISLTLARNVGKHQLREQRDLSPSLWSYEHGTGRRRNEDQHAHYQDLYYRLQNLEHFPGVLLPARAQLLSLLSEAVWIEQTARPPRSILHIESYDQVLLESFLAAEHDNTLHQWEAYNRRRSLGSGPELFASRDAANNWLKQNAPVKYVDGAWLGHVNRITTPFALRGITKAAWQVLSEELGDGDLQKHHVYVYQRLLDSVGIHLPDADSAEFVDRSHGMINTRVWKAAVAQLLISLFPNEFLPEILGFNLHYEQLTLDTLKATKELPEFKISGYYFLLHISIDNADSGHTAMALATVTRYMELVNKLGLMNVQEAWRRIQAGYVLSKTLGEDFSYEENVSTDPTIAAVKEPSSEYDNGTLTMQESEIINMLLPKANVSRKIHCTSQIRVGERTLKDWLSPDSWRTRGDFIEALADANPWVRRGDSSKSTLIKELSWGGKMFGAFTDTQVSRLRAWIDSLPVKPEEKAYQAYNRAVGQAGGKLTGTSPQSDQDLASHHPVFPIIPTSWLPEDGKPFLSPRVDVSLGPKTSIQMAEAPSISSLLVLWFTHTGLLENTVNIPFKTATLLGTALVRILRTEYGFAPETSGVAGIDEQLQSSGPSLIDIGLEMARSNTFGLANYTEPQSLKDVLSRAGDNEATTFSYNILSVAQRPSKHQGLLIGLACAFMELETWVADAEAIVLSLETREALRGIIKRKNNGFLQCLEELKSDLVELGEFYRGYELGRAHIIQVLEVKG
ncbi:hypothetical protein N7490_002089 [Penicillium lividum]|nr:hypothetical protein N7490_002089 [Penicillium lividum]